MSTSEVAASAPPSPGGPGGGPGGGDAEAAAQGAAAEAKRRRWTRREDEALREAVEAGSPWDAVARLVASRTADQCEQRWQKVLRNGLVKGAFTEEEDAIILESMRLGTMSWLEIAKRTPGRIGKQCRERWTNHLDPKLKKGQWTPDEDVIMAEAQERWGNAWTKIAELLPGRAENAVKNRWNSAFRRNNAETFGKATSPPSPAVLDARHAMEEVTDSTAGAVPTKHSLVAATERWSDAAASLPPAKRARLKQQQQHQHQHQQQHQHQHQHQQHHQQQQHQHQHQHQQEHQQQHQQHQQHQQEHQQQHQQEEKAEQETGEAAAVAAAAATLAEAAASSVSSSNVASVWAPPGGQVTAQIAMAIYPEIKSLSMLASVRRTKLRRPAAGEVPASDVYVYDEKEVAEVVRRLVAGDPTFVAPLPPAPPPAPVAASPPPSSSSKAATSSSTASAAKEDYSALSDDLEAWVPTESKLTMRMAMAKYPKLIRHRDQLRHLARTPYKRPTIGRAAACTVLCYDAGDVADLARREAAHLEARSAAQSRQSSPSSSSSRPPRKKKNHLAGGKNNATHPLPTTKAQATVTPCCWAPPPGTLTTRAAMDEFPVLTHHDQLRKLPRQTVRRPTMGRAAACNVHVYAYSDVEALAATLAGTRKKKQPPQQQQEEEGGSPSSAAAAAKKQQQQQQRKRPAAPNNKKRSAPEGEEEVEEVEEPAAVATAADQGPALYVERPLKGFRGSKPRKHVARPADDLTDDNNTSPPPSSRVPPIDLEVDDAAKTPPTPTSLVAEVKGPETPVTVLATADVACFSKPAMRDEAKPAMREQEAPVH